MSAFASPDNRPHRRITSRLSLIAAAIAGISAPSLAAVTVVVNASAGTLGTGF